MAGIGAQRRVAYIGQSYLPLRKCKPTVLELIIFAALAAVVLYQLYSVLGRRVGRQPDKLDAPVAVPTAAKPALDPIDDGVVLSGLAALKSRDPSFDTTHFLNGAASATPVSWNRPP